MVANATNATMGLSDEQRLVIMNDRYFHPVGIIVIVCIPNQLALVTMIFIRIGKRFIERKAIPPAMQLPGYVALSLFLCVLFQNIKVLYQFSTQRWMQGSACMVTTIIWLFFTCWTGIFMAITSSQYVLSIVRPRFLSSSNRFMNAKSLHICALLALPIAGLTASLGGTEVQSIGYCGFKRDTHGHQIATAIIYALALAVVVINYSWAIWHLNKMQRSRPASWSTNQGIMKLRNNSTRKATIKLFRYSLLTTFVTVPLITFPALYTRLSFPTDGYFQALIAGDTIIQLMPIALGLIWILNEGFWESPPSKTGSTAISEEPATHGDASNISSGPTPTFAPPGLTFPPHPGVNVKHAGTRVEVRPAGGTNRLWSAALVEKRSRMEQAHTVDGFDQKICEKTDQKGEQMENDLIPPLRNSANSQQPLIEADGLDHALRSSWQSAFFHPVSSNKEGGQPSVQDHSRSIQPATPTSQYSLESPLETHSERAESLPTITSSFYVSLEDLPAAEKEPE